MERDRNHLDRSDNARASRSANHTERPEREATHRATAPSTSIQAEVATLLRTAGIHAALAYLNARTRCRFTGVYQVDPPLLRNVHLFDRENPDLNIAGEVSSLDIGYCGIVCETGAPFTTSDAQHDPRLRAHAARDSMLAYAGAPIRMPDGRAWGTVCHFDLRPRIIVPEELSVLVTVTPLFATWVREHCGAS